MINNNADFRYKTTYLGPFEITHCNTNITVTLQYAYIKIRYSIGRIDPYTSDTNVEDIIF